MEAVGLNITNFSSFLTVPLLGTALSRTAALVLGGALTWCCVSANTAELAGVHSAFKQATA